MKKPKRLDLPVRGLLGGIFLSAGLFMLLFTVAMLLIMAATGMDEAEMRIAMPIVGGVCGLLGAIFLAIGIVQLRKNAKRKKQLAQLFENGVRVRASVLDCTVAGSNVTVNGHPLYTLRASYTDAYGKTYIFTRKHLRSNPLPLLREGEVWVLYSREDMHQYFVDIEGSLSEHVVEL